MGREIEKEIEVTYTELKRYIYLYVLKDTENLREVMKRIKDVLCIVYNVLYDYQAIDRK